MKKYEFKAIGRSFNFSTSREIMFQDTKGGRLVAPVSPQWLRETSHSLGPESRTASGSGRWFRFAGGSPLFSIFLFFSSPPFVRSTRTQKLILSGGLFSTVDSVLPNGCRSEPSAPVQVWPQSNWLNQCKWPSWVIRVVIRCVDITRKTLVSCWICTLWLTTKASP